MGGLGRYEEDLTMYNFEYVSKKEAAPAKNELIEIINDVQDILRNKDVSFQFQFIGRTDETHPISRVEFCRRLNEMGISSNVRTLSLDIEVMQKNGFEIMSYLKDKEKFYYVPEHELTVPEIKILIDAVQAASFITEKKQSS